MNPGIIINVARKIRGYSQVDLSGRYGISESTLRNYEKGRTQIPQVVFDDLLKYLHLTQEEVNNVAEKYTTDED
ncbi:MAG: helix-turn-helix transcriptional regulator [Alteromonadaceae bacterium]|nr:helix-turn-helix transcriptional regulator [Alteromonadaceae bacterium]